MSTSWVFSTRAEVADTSIQETKDLVLLQEIGIYEFNHRLANATADKDVTEPLFATIVSPVQKWSHIRSLTLTQKWTTFVWSLTSHS